MNKNHQLRSRNEAKEKTGLVWILIFPKLPHGTLTSSILVEFTKEAT